MGQQKLHPYRVLETSEGWFIMSPDGNTKVAKFCDMSEDALKGHTGDISKVFVGYARARPVIAELRNRLSRQPRGDQSIDYPPNTGRVTSEWED